VRQHRAALGGVPPRVTEITTFYLGLFFFRSQCSTSDICSIRNAYAPFRTFPFGLGVALTSPR
jgi:hypothetical protein